jgi:hypothetical protein
MRQYVSLKKLANVFARSLPELRFGPGDLSLRTDSVGLAGQVFGPQATFTLTLFQPPSIISVELYAVKVFP